MISSSNNRIIYNGNDSATEFPYQFKIINQSDIKVITVDPDGTETILQKDFFVDVEKSVVIYPGYAPGQEPPESDRPPVLPTGWKLVLYREVPITQESRLDDYFPFNVIEAMADKLTIICQQLYDGVNRCFRVGEATPIDVDTTVPWEAGKGFRISDDGKRIEVTKDPAKVLPIAEGLLSQTTQQANIATQQATAAAESALSAADSEVNAETAMTQARASAALSQKWAEAEESPDGQEDADSPTGDTMSAKEWALYAKQLTENIGNPITAITEEAGEIIIKKANGESNYFYVGAVNQSTKKLLDTNYDFATQEEVQAGSDTKKPVNSVSVKKAIEYNQNKDTAILYINGGTAEQPANVSINSRYVEENPFKGYYVYCEAQLLINDVWAKTNTGYYNQRLLGGVGVRAGQVLPSDTIIVQTGSIILAAPGGSTCDLWEMEVTEDVKTPTPCRVIIHKLGKIGETQ